MPIDPTSQTWKEIVLWVEDRVGLCHVILEQMGDQREHDRIRGEIDAARDLLKLSAPPAEHEEPPASY